MKILDSWVSAKLEVYLRHKWIDATNGDVVDAVKAEVSKIVTDNDAYHEALDILDRLLPEEYESRFENHSHAVSDIELCKTEDLADEMDKIRTFSLLWRELPYVLISGLIRSASRKKRRCNDVEARQRRVEKIGEE